MIDELIIILSDSFHLVIIHVIVVWFLDSLNLFLLSGPNWIRNVLDWVWFMLIVETRDMSSLHLRGILQFFISRSMGSNVWANAIQCTSLWKHYHWLVMEWFAILTRRILIISILYNFLIINERNFNQYLPRIISLARVSKSGLGTLSETWVMWSVFRILNLLEELGLMFLLEDSRTNLWAIWSHEGWLLLIILFSVEGSFDRFDSFVSPFDPARISIQWTYLGAIL